VWPSGWVRTLFFNPTRPDGQDPKPSPRARALELAQGSGSDRTWPPRQIRRTELSVQFNSSNKIWWSTLRLISQFELFVWVEIRVECSTNKYVCSIQLVEQELESVQLVRTEGVHPIQLVEQDLESVQPSRTEGVHSTLLKPRVWRLSSGSTQPKDNFIRTLT
jgi:hypothetical protein